MNPGDVILAKYTFTLRPVEAVYLGNTYNPDKALVAVLHGNVAEIGLVDKANPTLIEKVLLWISFSATRELVQAIEKGD